jgi:hypothetical protein
MKLVTFAVAGLLAGAAPALAQYAPRPVVPVGPMPLEGVFRMVRQMGLEPMGPPVRNGAVYVQRAADYYGKPLRVVIDASRAQVMSVEAIGGPPAMHRGPYASTGAPYWRRPYGPYMAPYDDDDYAPPGSMMAPYGQPPQPGLPPPTQAKPKSAAVTPGKPPVPRKRPSSAPQEAAGSVETLQPASQAAAPVPASPAAPAARPASPEMTPVAPLD